VDLSAQGILKLIQTFRKTKWFHILVLVVLGLVATGLWALTAAGPIGECLGVLLIPVSVFVIPYWLGERRLKTFAMNIVPVFIIAILLIAALQTQSILSQGDPGLSSGLPPNTANADLPPLSLWNGTVAPFSAPAPNQTYLYHVRLKMVGNVNRSTVSVHLNLTKVNGLSEIFNAYPMQRDPGRLNDTANGTWYETWHTLPPGIYGFYFYANDTRTNVTYSSGVLGPIIQPWPDWYGFILLFSAVNLIFPVSFYFVILFMYWYTLRNRKMRQRLIESSRAEKLDIDKRAEAQAKSGERKESAEPPAPTREKSRKVAAFTCTNCGADVTEADEKCPKCGAVFED
jgi:hypothetical protein